jgi:hypothetical protein
MPPSPLGGTDRAAPSVGSDRLCGTPLVSPYHWGSRLQRYAAPILFIVASQKKVLLVPPDCRSIRYIVVFVRAPGYRRAWSYGTLPAANRTFQSWFTAQGTPTSSRVASRGCCQHQPRSPRKDVSCGTRCSNTMLGPRGSHRFVRAGSSGFPPGGGPRLQWGGPALNPSATLLDPLGYPGGITSRPRPVGCIQRSPAGAPSGAGTCNYRAPGGLDQWCQHYTPRCIAL